jgi:hypothetical protein
VRPSPRYARFVRAFITLSFAALAHGIVMVGNPLRAEAEPVPDVSAETFAAREYNRAHTLAQLGLGLITLPAADVCLTPEQCTKGDTSLEVSFWQMYRANRYFAIGAGTSLALNPTVDNPPSDTAIKRNHTRGYFSVEAQGRYYALRMDLIELWLGITAGGVIISDRYAVAEDDHAITSSASQPAIIGPRSTTVRTEGLTVGGVMGAQWTIAPNWAIGAAFRYARWFVPDTPAKSAFLDSATLTGQQSVLYLGLLCSYRIVL